MKHLSRAILALVLLSSCGEDEKDPYRLKLDEFVIDKAPAGADEIIAFSMAGKFVRGEVLQGDTIVYRFVGRIEEPSIRLPDGTSLQAGGYQRFRTVSAELPRLRVHGGDEGQVAERTATIGKVPGADSDSTSK